jgi:hypothetical protein
VQVIRARDRYPILNQVGERDRGTGCVSGFPLPPTEHMADFQGARVFRTQRAQAVVKQGGERCRSTGSVS